jgi:hypothetical protein
VNRNNTQHTSFSIWASKVVYVSVIDISKSQLLEMAQWSPLLCTVVLLLLARERSGKLISPKIYSTFTRFLVQAMRTHELCKLIYSFVSTSLLRLALRVVLRGWRGVGDEGGSKCRHPWVPFVWTCSAKLLYFSIIHQTEFAWICCIEIKGVKYDRHLMILALRSSRVAVLSECAFVLLNL